eukprot:7354233-Pyramimonas_sp.AAC.1
MPTPPPTSSWQGGSCKMSPEDALNIHIVLPSDAPFAPRPFRHSPPMVQGLLHRFQVQARGPGAQGPKCGTRYARDCASPPRGRCPPPPVRGGPRRKRRRELEEL